MLCISTMATMTEDEKEMRVRAMGWVPTHEKIIKKQELIQENEPDTHYNIFFGTASQQEVNNFLLSYGKNKIYNFALSSIKRYKEEIQGVNSEYCRKHSQLVARRGEDLKKFDVEKEKLKKNLKNRRL